MSCDMCFHIVNVHVLSTVLQSVFLSVLVLFWRINSYMKYHTQDVISIDLKCLNKIFNDTKHRAVHLRQLSFLFYSLTHRLHSLVHYNVYSVTYQASCYVCCCSDGHGSTCCFGDISYGCSALQISPQIPKIQIQTQTLQR